MGVSYQTHQSTTSAMEQGEPRQGEVGRVHGPDASVLRRHERWSDRYRVVHENLQQIFKTVTEGPSISTSIHPPNNSLPRSSISAQPHPPQTQCPRERQLPEIASTAQDTAAVTGAPACVTNASMAQTQQATSEVDRDTATQAAIDAKYFHGGDVPQSWPAPMPPHEFGMSLPVDVERFCARGGGHLVQVTSGIEGGGVVENPSVMVGHRTPKPQLPESDVDQLKRVSKELMSMLARLVAERNKGALFSTLRTTVRTTMRWFVQTEAMKAGLSLTSHESSGRVHCDKTASSSDNYYQWIANAVEACSDQMMHDMLCAVFSEIEIRRFFAVRRLPRDAQSMHEMKRLVVQGLQNVWSRKQKRAFMHLLLKCTNTGFFEHLGMFEATKDLPWRVEQIRNMVQVPDDDGRSMFVGFLILKDVLNISQSEST